MSYTFIPSTMTSPTHVLLISIYTNSQYSMYLLDTKYVTPDVEYALGIAIEYDLGLPTTDLRNMCDNEEDGKKIFVIDKKWLEPVDDELPDGVVIKKIYTFV